MADALAGRRGQPLVALCLIVVVWGGARTAMWGGVGSLPEMPAKAETVQVGARPAPVRIGPSIMPALADTSNRAGQALRTPTLRQGHSGGDAGEMQWQSDMSRLVSVSLLRHTNPALAAPRTPERAAQAVVEPDAALSAIPIKDDPRWSGDNWLLMRAGSGAAAQAPTSHQPLATNH